MVKYRKYQNNRCSYKSKNIEKCAKKFTTMTSVIMINVNEINILIKNKNVLILAKNEGIQ